MTHTSKCKHCIHAILNECYDGSRNSKICNYILKYFSRGMIASWMVIYLVIKSDFLFLYE